MSQPSPEKRRFVPGWPDLAMLLAAGPTLLWWSTGINFIRLGALASLFFFVLWAGLGIWWLASRPHRIWAPIVGLVLLVSVWQGAFDLAFRMERDCLTAKAEAALEMADDTDSFRRISEEGACGLLDYGFMDLVTIPEISDGVVPAYDVVVFRDAGPGSTKLFNDQAGYVYSPSHVPRGCRGALGPDNYSACTVTDLGDSWFRVGAAIASN